VLFSYGHNKTFLVSDTCRATVRNGNRINANLTEDTNENDYNDACFSANLTEDTNENDYNDACFSANLTEDTNENDYNDYYV
jgi:HEPN domain-containing protein